MTLAVEIQEVQTAEELDHVRELFRSYRDGLPPHLRFPDAEWRERTLARRGTAAQNGCAAVRRIPRTKAAPARRRL